MGATNGDGSSKFEILDSCFMSSFKTRIQHLSFFLTRVCAVNIIYDKLKIGPVSV